MAVTGKTHRKQTKPKEEKQARGAGKKQGWKTEATWDHRSLKLESM